MLKIYTHLIIVFTSVIVFSNTEGRMFFLDKTECFLTESNKLNDLLNQAEKLTEAKEYIKAIDIYNEALRMASQEKLSNDVGFIYNKIGLIYYNQGKLPKAICFFKKSISKDSLSQHTADSYFNLSLIYRKLKKEDSLLLNLRNSLITYKTQKDSYEKYNTNYKAGILYKNAGMYDKAMGALLYAYKGFDALNNVKKKASVCNVIAVIQRLIGNYKIAEKYYKEGVFLRKISNDTLGMSNSYNSIGVFFMNQKKYDAAIVNYKKAIDLKKAIGAKKEIGRVYSNLASVYQLKNNVKKAIETYEKALKLKLELQDTTAIASTYNELAILEIANNNSSQAKKYLDVAKNNISILQNKDILLRNYEVQSYYYKTINDFKSALSFKEKHQILYQSIFNEQQSKIVQGLQEKFESKLKAQEILELSESNTLKENIISVQKKILKQKNILIVFIGLLTLCVYLYFKQRQKMIRKEHELKHLEAIFQGQEVIKERISKDLHDIITSNYDGIRLKVLALSKAKNINAMITTIVEEIKEINHQVRLISHRLSPLGTKIKDTALTEIIISQLSEFQYYRKIFIDIQLPFPKELDKMKLKSQTNFYGIILEILSNIEKHSLATKVLITHHIESNVISFKMSDNGIGFDLHQQQKGIGLMNIKQRTFSLKGSCNIKSSNKGTQVVVKFPINTNLK